MACGHQLATKLNQSIAWNMFVVAQPRRHVPMTAQALRLQAADSGFQLASRQLAAIRVGLCGRDLTPVAVTHIAVSCCKRRVSKNTAYASSGLHVGVRIVGATIFLLELTDMSVNVEHRAIRVGHVGPCNHTRKQFYVRKQCGCHVLCPRSRPRRDNSERV